MARKTQLQTLRAWRLSQSPQRTQEVVADALKVKQQTVQRWESINPDTRRRPDVDDLVAIEAYTGGKVTAKSFTLEFMRACECYTKTA